MDIQNGFAVDINSDIKIAKVGDEVQGEIFSIEHSAVYIDLRDQGVGIIYGKEFIESKDSLKKLKKGDIVTAEVKDFKNEDGYMELSVTGIQKKQLWQSLEDKKENNEIFQVKIVSANKGGLIANIAGIPAFIPVSQLSSAHYPRVEDGEATKILQKLQPFINKEFNVRVADFNEAEEKIILTEKAEENEKISVILEKNYNVGDVVEGVISGTAKFGAFIRFNKEGVDDIEGLIHISEIDWKLLSSPLEVLKVGQKVQAKIINISDSKVFLSIKALQENPWQEIAKNYKKGSEISGKITKFSPYGAFVQINKKIQALIHISQFKSVEDMQNSLEIGKEYNFEILVLEPHNFKINLKLKK